MELRDPRTVLERLVRERGEDYVGLSRMLGRNASYVQQFVKRGVPRRLAEDDRRRLAAYFSIAEHQLGGPAPVVPEPPPRIAPEQLRCSIVFVPRLSVRASAGSGEAVRDERATTAYAFDRTALRALTRGRVESASVIGVRGDSMLPHFGDGDDILVDTGPEARRLRDGVYVLRLGDDLVVKRVALTPAGVEVRSDNPDYPSWPPCPADRIDVVGRVVWAARRVP